MNKMVAQINHADCEDSQQAMRLDFQFIREHGYSKNMFADHPGMRITILGDVMRVMKKSFIAQVIVVISYTSSN